MEALEGHTVTSYEDSGSTELGRCGCVIWAHPSSKLFIRTMH